MIGVVKEMEEWAKRRTQTATCMLKVKLIKADLSSSRGDGKGEKNEGAQGNSTLVMISSNLSSQEIFYSEIKGWEGYWAKNSSRKEHGRKKSHEG